MVMRNDWEKFKFRVVDLETGECFHAKLKNVIPPTNQWDARYQLEIEVPELNRTFFLGKRAYEKLVVFRETHPVRSEIYMVKNKKSLNWVPILEYMIQIVE